MLQDIAVEEMGHLEMVGRLIESHTRGAGKTQAYDSTLFAMRGLGPHLLDSQGTAWSASYINEGGHIVRDLRADIGAEVGARQTYESLSKLCPDKGTEKALVHLLTREISHTKMFMKALESLGKLTEPFFGDVKPDETVDLYFNLSKPDGAGGGEADARGPWNKEPDFRYVESPEASGRPPHQTPPPRKAPEVVVGRFCERGGHDGVAPLALRRLMAVLARADRERLCPAMSSRSGAEGASVRGERLSPRSPPISRARVDLEAPSHVRPAHGEVHRLTGGCRTEPGVERPTPSLDAQLVVGHHARVGEDQLPERRERGPVVPAPVAEHRPRRRLHAGSGAAHARLGELEPVRREPVVLLPADALDRVRPGEREPRCLDAREQGSSHQRAEREPAHLGAAVDEPGRAGEPARSCQNTNAAAAAKPSSSVTGSAATSSAAESAAAARAGQESGARK